MAKQLLRQVKVASPCHVSWSEMTGDERVRHCSHCKMNVFNLSEMSDKEAETLLRETNGRLCVRYYQRADGTVMTRNCPVGLRAIRRRTALVLIGAVAMVAAAFGAVSRPRGAEGTPTPNSGEPSFAMWDKVQCWLLGKEEPKPPMRMIQGEVAVSVPRTSGKP
jgi:hypothetical protein